MTKNLFTTWLAIHDRLPTKTRIQKWMEECDTGCVVCSLEEENLQHLLIDCVFAKEVRDHVFSFLPASLIECTLQEEIKHMTKLNRKTSDTTKLIVTCWTGMIYGIWFPRNTKVFEGQHKGLASLAWHILYRVAVRVKESMRVMLIKQLGGLCQAQPFCARLEIIINLVFVIFSLFGQFILFYANSFFLME